MWHAASRGRQEDRTAAPGACAFSQNPKPAFCLKGRACVSFLAILLGSLSFAVAAQVATEPPEEATPAKADPEKIQPIIDAYKRALEATPTAPGLNLRFGVRLWERGELVESTRAFERELQIDPGNLRAQAMLGIIKVRQQKYAEAAEELRVIVDKDPSLTQIWHPLGRAWFEVGRFEDARRCLEQAASVEPGNPRIQALLAKTYTRLSDPANAKHASALYSEALKLKRSRDLAGLGKWREALQTISQYLVSFPLSSEGLYVKAAVLFNGYRNLDLAVETVRRAIAQDKANLEARNLLAILLLAKGDSIGFEQEAQALLEMDPMDSHANYYLGRFESDGNRLAEAREHLERARLVQPNDPLIATTLATTYEKLGMKPQAEAEYKKGIELSCSRPGDGSAYTYYAAFLLNENRIPEALRYLNEAIALPSVRAEGWYLAGVAHLQNGDLTKAEQCLEKAIERRPNYAEAHSALARVLRTKGDTVGAQREAALGREVANHALRDNASDSSANNLSIPR